MSDSGNHIVQSLGAESGHSNGHDRLLSTCSKDGSHRWSIAGRSSLFLGILPADYQKISGAARIETFDREEFLYIEGDPAAQVILLTSGLVKITQVGTTGKQVFLRFGVPGDVLDSTSLYLSTWYRRTAQAFRMCQAYIWDARTFRSLVYHWPVLHQNMARLLSEDLLEIEERFRELATEKVASRVGRQILRLMERIGRPVNGAIEVSLSREELAQMTGTTLFTVSRLLSGWETRGVVKPRRKSVTICDARSLRALSDEEWRSAYDDL